MPILDAAAAWFVGTIVDRFSLGDHVGHLLEPMDSDPPHELEQWVSFRDVHDLERAHPEAERPRRALLHFASLLPAVRAVRERIDWEQVRKLTADNDFATAFLVLADRLGITH